VTAADGCPVGGNPNAVIYPNYMVGGGLAMSGGPHGMPYEATQHPGGMMGPPNIAQDTINIQDPFSDSMSTAPPMYGLAGKQSYGAPPHQRVGPGGRGPGLYDNRGNAIDIFIPQLLY